MIQSPTPDAAHYALYCYDNVYEPIYTASYDVSFVFVDEDDEDQALCCDA